MRLWVYTPRFRTSKPATCSISAATIVRWHSFGLRSKQSNTEELRIARSTASRSEEHTSELQSLMRISYAAFCLKKNKSPYRTHLYTLQQHLSRNFTSPI